MWNTPTNVQPESYLQPTDKVFSLKAPNIITVCKLLSDINERKATGLDKIPCKLFKLSRPGDIVGPSLTDMFKSSIDNGLFPSEWKVAKVTLSSKKVLNPTLTIADQYLYYHCLKNFRENYLPTTLWLLKWEQALEQLPVWFSLTVQHPNSPTWDHEQLVNQYRQWPLNGVIYRP